MKKNYDESNIVDLIAPGYAPELKNIKLGLKLLKNHFDLKGRVSKNIIGNDILCSNSDKYRLNDLKKSIYNKRSEIIWCVRGGYGSHRLLNEMMSQKKPNYKKLLIGYSDITSLHLFFNNQWGWPTLHGPVLDGMINGGCRPIDLKILNKILNEKSGSIRYSNFQPLNNNSKKNLIIKGKLSGGNLTTYISSFGTPWEDSMKDKILFFEEIGESPRKIDRNLVQLMNQKNFKKIRGIIFGDFLGCVERKNKSLWKQILSRFAKEVELPVFWKFPSGHGIDKRPLPFGVEVTLKSGKQPCLEFNIERIWK